MTDQKNDPPSEAGSTGPTDNPGAGGYAVGFGKPPKATQFKKEKSGNPRGRPARSRNLKTELLEEISEKIAIREQGVPKTVSKLRATLKSLVAKAVQGDARAAKLVIDQLSKLLEDEAPPKAVTQADLAKEDQAIIDRFLQREVKKDEVP